MIRALIVEDAPLLRSGIRLYLKDQQDVEVVGEACDGPEAVERINALRPDMVFLDVQLPGFDGFEVLSRSHVDGQRCAIVFITAHADYALRAFDYNAVGYLLKPFDGRRFAQIIDRARVFLRSLEGQVPTTVMSSNGVTSDGPGDDVISTQLNGQQRLTRIPVRHAGRILLIKLDEIDYIAATGEYVTIHTSRGSWLLRTSLTELGLRLDDRQFARIHRGTIVNLDRVAEIQPRGHGDCDVRLQSGRVLRLSRGYRDSVFRGTRKFSFHCHRAGRFG
jgi:two-component system, LytTR family, response regulator